MDMIRWWKKNNLELSTEIDALKFIEYINSLEGINDGGFYRYFQTDCGKLVKDKRGFLWILEYGSWEGYEE